MEKSEKSHFHYDSSVPAPDYSTLEVARNPDAFTPPPPHPMHMPKYAAQQMPQQIPQGIPQYPTRPVPQHPAPTVVTDRYSYQEPVSPESPERGGGYYGPVVDKSPIVPWSTFDARSPPPMTGYPPPVPPKDMDGSGRRICGFRRKSFFIVSGLIALILLGVILGATLGTTLGKKSSSGAADQDRPGEAKTDPAPSTWGNSTEDAQIILPESRLSAINWTDEGQVEHRAVFWQDRSTALMMSYWDSADKQWTVTNVSASAGANATAKPGTPLAATVRAPPYTTKYHPFMLAVFYIGRDDNSLEVVTSASARGETWKTGDLSARTVRYTAHATSGLAVHFSLCWETCSGDMYLLYENPDNKLLMLTSADWTRQPLEVAPNMAGTSGIAVTASADRNASNGVQADLLQAYYQTNNVVVEVGKPAKDNAWGGKGNTILADMPTDSSGSRPVDLAVVTWALPEDTTGPRRKVLVARQPDGSLVANHWDNKSWQDARAPHMDGAPGGAENCTAVALVGGSEIRAYGRTDRGIVGYTIDARNPFEWKIDEVIRVRGAPPA